MWVIAYRLQNNLDPSCPTATGSVSHTLLDLALGTLESRLRQAMANVNLCQSPETVEEWQLDALVSWRPWLSSSYGGASNGPSGFPTTMT